jgi:hypothetical protein
MATQSQRNLEAAPTEAPTLGAALGSGVRGSRRNAPSPPSGVHSRQDLHTRQTELTRAGYVPPRPTFDSEPPMTRVKRPDPALLAMARGEVRGAHVRRMGWFVLGALAGACAVWFLTSDVTADVFRARVWIASELRSLHGHDDAGDATAPSASSPAPAAALRPMTVPPIPAVDVSRLPRSTAPRAPATASSPTLGPSSPGAPALQHAPGPR